MNNFECHILQLSDTPSLDGHFLANSPDDLLVGDVLVLALPSRDYYGGVRMSGNRRFFTTGRIDRISPTKKTLVVEPHGTEIPADQSAMVYVHEMASIVRTKSMFSFPVFVKKETPARIRQALQSIAYGSVRDCGATTARRM